jgi:Protein of unknown function (DUF2934)
MAKVRTPRAPKVKVEKPETKVLQMPETTVSNGNGHHNSPELESEIRRRAYELYERGGYVDGRAEQDWFEAEREVLSRNQQKHSA